MSTIVEQYLDYNMATIEKRGNLITVNPFGDFPFTVSEAELIQIATEAVTIYKSLGDEW